MTVISSPPANTPEAWTLRAQTEPTSWGAAGWTESGQRDRISCVLRALDPRPGERLLDYGCGTGELAAHISCEVDYLGIDTATGMIVRAEKEHPGRSFQTWEPATLTADIVAGVGPFNLPDNWSKLRTWATLRRLWDGTTRALAASLYAGEDDRCLIYTEEECERFARGEAFAWRVERWRPNDILIVLNRDPRKRVFL